jgi:transposase-like protein
LELNVSRLRADGVSKVPKPKSKPVTEVVPTRQNDRRQRRRFSPEDKARIVKEADACVGSGEVGALLRREGIYSSHLHNWRAQIRQSGLAGLVDKQPGVKSTRDPKDRVIEQLEAKNARLEKELRISRHLIDMQIKAHEILGIALPRIEEASEDDSSRSSNSAKRRSR